MGIAHGELDFTEACSSRDLVAPEVTSQPSSASPNLDSARIERVLGSIQDTINTADATRDAAALEPRLEGGALRMRSDQYAAAKATNTEVPKLVVNQGSVAVTNSDQWPRVIVNVSSPDQASLPVLAFAVQDDARSNYKLVGWTRALGGAQFQLDNVEKGSAALGPDAQGFVKTPKEALQGYVDMLNSGNAGNDQYAGDDFARRYLQDAKSLNDAVQAAGNVQAHADLSADFPIVGVELVDGSALVAASFTYTQTYQRTVARSTMRLGGTTAALAEGDDDTVKGKATATYIVTVLLHIPKTGSDSQLISAVGAERALGSVVKDDGAGNPDHLHE